MEKKKNRQKLCFTAGNLVCQLSNSQPTLMMEQLFQLMGDLLQHIVHTVKTFVSSLLQNEKITELENTS